MRRGDFHGRFVALHGDQALIRLDGVARLDHEFDDGHFGEVADVGYFDVYDCHFLFLTVEDSTKGLSADNGDRIIEIGCVEMVNRKPTGNNCHIYVNPGRDSHEEALKVHGITSDFLKDKPKFEDIAEDLLAYLQGAEVVIHNAPFDLGF